MISNSRQVTVNAAFLKEIKEDNLRLYNLMENLRTFWLVPDPLALKPEWFSVLINELRDQLAMHFALEATFGYFDHADQVDALTAAESQRLRDQHEDLYLEIASIAEQVEEALYPEWNQTTYAAQIERFDQFYQKFQQHESAEFDLIMSASYENFKRMYHSGVSSRADSARW